MYKIRVRDWDAARGKVVTVGRLEFSDFRSAVEYWRNWFLRNQNGEGSLGLNFHPNRPPVSVVLDEYKSFNRSGDLRFGQYMCNLYFVNERWPELFYEKSAEKALALILERVNE